LEIEKFKLRDKILWVFRGVYRPAQDSLMLLDAVIKLDKNFEFGLDLGCGCGINTIFLAEKCSEVLAVDINPKATRNTWINVKLNCLSDKVHVVVGDLLNFVGRERIFDIVLLNPPYLPEDEYDKYISTFEKLSWNGGVKGRNIIDRFIHTIPQFLSGKGIILMVQSSLSNLKETVKMFREEGFKVEILETSSFFYEKLHLIKAFREG